MRGRHHAHCRVQKMVGLGARAVTSVGFERHLPLAEQVQGAGLGREEKDTYRVSPLGKARRAALVGRSLSTREPAGVYAQNCLQFSRVSGVSWAVLVRGVLILFFMGGGAPGQSLPPVMWKLGSRLPVRQLQSCPFS